MLRYAKFIEAFGSALILGAALWWALDTAPYESRLAGLDRELLFSAVEAVQDDVLRSSTWSSGDQKRFNIDLDVIFKRAEMIRKEKSDLKELRSEIAERDGWRVGIFVLGSLLVIFAKILEGTRDLTQRG